jgi:pyroglutamyl-peptidase
MPMILLTGFTPFDGAEINPSWEAVRRLAAERSHEVAAVQIPTTFALAIDSLEEAIGAHQPQWVICAGLAPGRSAITPERVAINVNDARIPDNDGEQPVDVPVVAGGPAAYFSTLPVKASIAALRAAGLPARISNTAGTFVCNNVFYGLMHLIHTRFPGMRGGFVHVPYAPEQVPEGREPSMIIEAISRGLGVIVDTCLEVAEDRSAA